MTLVKKLLAVLALLTGCALILGGGSCAVTIIGNMHGRTQIFDSSSFILIGLGVAAGGVSLCIHACSLARGKPKPDDSLDP